MIILTKAEDDFLLFQPGVEKEARISFVYQFYSLVHGTHKRLS